MNSLPDTPATAGPVEDDFRRYRDAADVPALGRVFDAIAPELEGVAIHLTRDAERCADLIQQTFLSIIESAHRFEDGQRAVPWALGILVNLWRQQRRRSGRILDERRLEMAAPIGPPKSAQASEALESVRSALTRIPDLYQEVLRRYLFEDTSPQQIARDLERQPGTVRVQVMRGLEHLRRLLPVGLAGAAIGGVTPAMRAASRAQVMEAARTKAALASGSAVASSASLTLLKCALAASLLAGILWVSGLLDGDDARPVSQESSTSAAVDPVDPPAALPSVATSATIPASPPSAVGTSGDDQGSGQAHDGRLVRLTIGATGAPAAGAVVDLTTKSAMLEFEQTPWPARANSEPATQQLVADDEGQVWIPRDQCFASVTCGEHFAKFAADGRWDDPFDTALEQSRHLQVRAVGPDGEPRAGVVVRARAAGSVSALTGDDGRATLRNVQLALGDDVSLDVVADLPVLDPPVVSVDLSAPPAEVTLSLEATGSIEVHVVEPDGQPSERASRVELSRVDSTQASPSRTDATRTRTAGTYRVPFVWLGQQWRIAVHAHDRVAPIEVSVDGPDVPGATRTVTVTLPQSAPRLSARFVTEGGRPLGDSVVKLLVCGSGFEESEGHQWGFGSTTRVETDSQGVAEFSVEPNADEVCVYAYDSTDELGAPIYSGAAPRDDAELGEFTLSLLPVVASGTVLDPAGRPLAGARVVSPSATEGWRGWIDEVWSDEQGRFELRGLGDDTPIRLSAFHPRHESAAAMCEYGGAVDLHMRPITSRPLTIQLVSHSAIPLDAFAADLMTADDQRFPLIVDLSGLVEQQIPPGLYDLHVRSRADDWQNEAPLVVRGLQITENGCDDGRLKALDVDIDFRSTELAVLTSDGAPIGGGRLEVFPSANRHGAWIQTLEIQDGRVRVVLPRACNARMVVDGYRPLDLALDGGTQTVELMTRIAVSTRCRNPEALAGFEYVWLELSSGDRPRRSQRSGDYPPTSRATLGRPSSELIDGLAEFELSEPGPHWLALYVGLSDGSPSENRLSGAGRVVAGPFEIREILERQHFEFEVDPASVAEDYALSEEAIGG